MTIENTYERDKIDVYASDKKGPYICIDDLIYALIERMPEEAAQRLVDRILGSFRFFEKLAQILTTGRGDFYDNNAGDALRLKLVPYAEESTVLFAEHLIDANRRLQDKLDSALEQNKRLEAEWPEAFKRYVPKERFIYSSLYVDKDDVVKCIELYKEGLKAKKELDIS